MPTPDLELHRVDPPVVDELPVRLARDETGALTRAESRLTLRVDQRRLARDHIDELNLVMMPMPLDHQLPSGNRARSRRTRPDRPHR